MKVLWEFVDKESPGCFARLVETELGLFLELPQDSLVIPNDDLLELAFTVYEEIG